MAKTKRTLSEMSIEAYYLLNQWFGDDTMIHFVNDNPLIDYIPLKRMVIPSDILFSDDNMYFKLLKWNVYQSVKNIADKTLMVKAT